MSLALYAVYIAASEGVVWLLFWMLKKMGTVFPPLFETIAHIGTLVVAGAFLWASALPETARFLRASYDETREALAGEKDEEEPAP